LLASHATTEDQQIAVANLPDTTSLQGLISGTTSLESLSSFKISSAQAKALGILDPFSSALDGAVGIGTLFTGTLLYNGALHELTHAMGRLVGDSLDLFRFNEDASGQRVFGGAIPASPAYFSIDGGATKLADFGINSDPGDWLNGGVQDGGIPGHIFDDPFDETVGFVGLTQVDTTVMNVLGFAVAPPPPPPGPPGPSRLVLHAGDFNGDGNADILFQSSSGVTWQWLMNANQISTTSETGNPGAQWHVVGSGHFTLSSPTQSILVQNDSGDVGEWNMNGSQITSSADLGNLGSNWHVVGTGDFTGAGEDDVLLQSDSGDIWEEQMNAGKVASQGEIANPGSNWHVVGAGDFGGTGVADILMQSDSGDVWEWQMNGNQIVASAEVGNPGQSWHVAGTGHFDGGSQSDILLQSDDGQIWQWQMNGFQIANSTAVGDPGASWHVASIGDFNGDGKDDILLQNDSGQVWQWQMNGNQIMASNSVGNPGSGWSVV
jgi:FG-GAP repeat